jgi:hypothetical protein
MLPRASEPSRRRAAWLVTSVCVAVVVVGAFAGVHSRRADAVAVTSTTARPAVPRDVPVVPAHPGPIRVAVYTDSLGFEARGAIVLNLAAAGMDVRYSGRPGTAPCDWTTPDHMGADASWAPDVVVLEFSGNNETPCTIGPDGQPLTGPALVASYAQSADEVMRIFPSARVFFASFPVRRTRFVSGDPSDSELNALWASMPRRYANARFVDPAPAVLDGGRYADTLPCRPGEPSCGVDAPPGQVKVRNDDGLHFCPITIVGPWVCNAYSPGAVRFGTALADDVLAGVR